MTIKLDLNYNKNIIENGCGVNQMEKKSYICSRLDGELL